MRQLTRMLQWDYDKKISKLPMRQLTICGNQKEFCCISKLPMRQLTQAASYVMLLIFSKLPMRQLTSRVSIT